MFLAPAGSEPGTFSAILKTHKSKPMMTTTTTMMIMMIEQ
jgi:hypothetical protein